MSDPAKPDEAKEHIDEELDEALEESFPASDPLPPDIGVPDRAPPQ